MEPVENAMESIMEHDTIASRVSVARRYVRAVDLGRDIHDPDALIGFVSTPSVQEAIRRLGAGLRPESGQRAFRVTGPYGSGKSSFAVLLAQALRGGDRATALVEGSELDHAEEKMVVIPLIGRRVSLGDDILAHLSSPSDAPQPSLDLLAAIAATREARSMGHHDPDAVLTHIEAYAAEMAAERRMLVFLIDEMGRYIEHAATAPDEDPSIFQRLAERACGPSKAPFGVVGFLHSQFSDYAVGMGQWTQGEWARSAERYEDIAFGNGEEAAVHLLANAIQHEPSKVSVNEIAAKLYGEAKRRGLFVWQAAEKAPETSRLYPLHPAVVVCLVAASRRLGQAERSMFSFLNAREPAGLMRFAERVHYGADSWYLLSDYYDYLAARPALRFRTSDRGRRWNDVQEAVATRQDLSDFERDVLKAAGVLLVLDPVTGLRPNAETLSWCLGESFDRVAAAIETLVEAAIVWKRPGGTLALRSGSTVDLDRWRVDADAHVPRTPVLNRGEPYTFIAHRHYHQTGTLRAFPLVVSNDPSRATPPFGDGMVCVVPLLSSSEEGRMIEQTQRASRTAGLANVYCLMRVTTRAVAAAHDVAAWNWVEETCTELRLDDTARAEVAARREAAAQAVVQELRPFDAMSAGSDIVGFFHDGERIEVASRKELNTLLSDACDARFSAAPILRNDLINRSRLSSAISTARGRLFDAMFMHADVAELGFNGAPPERTIYLSMLREAQLHTPIEESSEKWHLHSPPPTDPLRWRPSWNALDALVSEEGGAGIPAILNCLAAEPFGLRQGPTLVLLATYLIVERAHLALMERGTYRPEPDGACLMRMAKGPQNFRLRKLVDSVSEKALPSRIADLLRDRPGVPKMPAKPAIGDVTAAIYGWTAKLRPFAWETRSISKRAQTVRSALQKARDPVDLLHRQLPTACGCDTPDENDFALALEEVFNELQDAVPQLRDRALAVTLQAFAARSVKDLRARLKTEIEPFLIELTDYRLRAFATRSLDDGLDTGRWIETIASLLTSKRLEAWGDSDLDAYAFAVRECAGQIDRFIALARQAGQAPVAAVHIALPGGADRAYYIRPSTSADEDDVVGSLRAVLAEADDPQRVLVQLFAEVFGAKEIERS